jgi:hypothetical protein
MSFQTTTLKYGWVYLTALGVITGTTIYVVNNTRQQVKPEDIIEIALGTYERCLATQTSTNPTYSVTPPSFVRTWMKTNAVGAEGNAYRINYTNYWPSTNGTATNIDYVTYFSPSIVYAQSWTTTGGYVWVTNYWWPSIDHTDSYENVTNTIGWHIDRDMMVSLDTAIKSLVPYYVDTNSAYDGMTNIVMLTVTGLWASLGIGDKTNQFTRTPAWTNPVSTNWIVNYTSYWPSTNGTATNINYTSDYRQVVNYAQSWTATGGHVWVTSSNWASSVVTVTNAATYGDYPWQIYVEDLQERYKVLNALKTTWQLLDKCDIEYREFSALNLSGLLLTNEASQGFLTNTTVNVYQTNVVYRNQPHYWSWWPTLDFNEALGCFTDKGHIYGYGEAYVFSSRVLFGINTYTNLSIKNTIPVYIKICPMWRNYYAGGETIEMFDDQGTGLPNAANWTIIENLPVSEESVKKSDTYWGHNNLQANPPSWWNTNVYSAKGFAYDANAYVTWQFNYCTNSPTF